MSSCLWKLFSNSGGCWGVRLAPPFRPCPLTPALSPEGRGGTCVVDGGFSWCFGGVEEWVESIILRRALRFLRSPSPGPFTNGPYDIAAPASFTNSYGITLPRVLWSGCYSGGGILVTGSWRVAFCQASLSSCCRSVVHSMTTRSMRGGSRPAVTDGGSMSTLALKSPYSTWKCGGGCSRKRIRMMMLLNLQSSGTGGDCWILSSEFVRGFSG